MCLAVPGQVIEIEGDDPLLIKGRVNFAGTIQEVNLALVPDVKVGDYVYVHVGVALSIIDQDEALETLRIIDMMTETDNHETDA